MSGYGELWLRIKNFPRAKLVDDLAYLVREQHPIREVQASTPEPPAELPVTHIVEFSEFLSAH